MPDRRSFLAALSLGPLAISGRARAQTAQPYAVVVGDSIAEGEPQRKGRLNMQGRFVPDHVSQPGQLSYELAAASGVFHFNHGIGGQTSTAVRARWRRDVLSEDNDPGDGRGPRTLPAGALPQLAYLHVGINDVASGVPLSSLQDNFSYFAQSTHGRMILVVDNIGAWLGMTDPMIEVATAFNRWLVDTLALRSPHVAVVDYLSWSSNGSNNFRTMSPERFADGLHPTMAGYADFAQFIRRTLKLPANSPIRY